MMFVFLLSLLASAQLSLSAQSPVSPTAKCAIDGQVLSASSGEPVKRAYLTLRAVGSRRSPLTVRADPSGRFSFSGLEPGNYRLVIERNGYVRTEYGARRPGRPGTLLNLEPGQSLHQLFVRLLSQSVIVGRVYDEDGDPVPDARVQASQISYSRGRRQLLPAGEGTTNDLGEYRIPGLGPGRYYIGAVYRPTGAGASRASDDDRISGESRESYAPTYYPGTSDPSSAAPVDVDAGSQLRAIDLTLLRTPTSRIRGRVWGGATGPAQSAIVVLVPRESSRLGLSNRSATSVLDSEGNFEINGVAPGSYLVWANWGNGSARQPIEVLGTNQDGVNLSIIPNIEVVGRIRTDGPRSFSLSTLRVLLLCREALPNAFGERVREDGGFRIPSVAVDSYRIQVAGLPENLYVKSIRFGSENVLESGLTLNTSGTSLPLEIQLGTTGGEIDGSVHDDEGNPVTAATVVLVPDAPRRSQVHLYKSTSTDQYGRFVLQGIAPGDYKLFAWEDVEADASQDSEFLSALEGKGAPFTVGELSRQSANVKLIPAVGLRGIGSTPPAHN